MAIPHPSEQEQALAQYLLDFAEAKGLEAMQDEGGNVIIRKGATSGMEDRQGIILQGHIDMVPQKSADKEFDFSLDPIEGYIDGDWVRANGTTLGADNGLGVAASLAILEDEELAHGELEALFTVNEERGMDGAFALQPDVLKGDILLNLDTEVEGELCIGCAGGLNIVASFEYDKVESPKSDYVARRLEVSGLKGGHSGIQINEQRGNANKLLFRLLRLTKLEILLVEVNGGSLSNAIPREAYADLLIHNDDIELFEEQVARFEQTTKAEYATIDSNVSVSLSEIDYPEEMIDEDVAACVVWAIAGCPDGVMKMSYTMPDLVQTSSNLAIVKTTDEAISVELFLRSSCESEKVALADSIASVFELADADVECKGGNPGWLPNVESPVLKSMVAGYKSLFGEEPTVLAVHAGLECGAIGATYPNLDMISFGPTIVSPHSPDEMAQISSVEKFYKLLRYTIESAPKRG